MSIIESRAKHVLVIAALVGVAPVAIALAIPATPGWLAFYVLAMIVLAVLASVLQLARERYLARTARAAAMVHEDRLRARAKVDSLIRRDRGLP